MKASLISMSVIREALELNELYTADTDTKDMIADIQTKAVKVADFVRLEPQFRGVKEWVGLKHLPDRLRPACCRHCTGKDLEHMYDSYDELRWFAVCGTCGSVTWA